MSGHGVSGQDDLSVVEAPEVGEHEVGQDGLATDEGSETKVARTATNWGVFDVHVKDDRVVDVKPFAADPDPSPIGASLLDAAHHPTRVSQPMVRRGWLEQAADHGRHRGREPFVAVSWERALDLAAAELQRVKDDFGNEAIYAGSYGWASAGRFHHAQSQLHRFLNLFGGSTRSMNSYSTAAAQVILPHVVAPWHAMEAIQTTWSDVAEGCELFVAFGGLPHKNAQVSYGGITEHQTKPGTDEAARRGVRFVTIGPQRRDTPAELDARWIALRPGTDTALLLALAHTLETEGLVDREFVATHTVGYERLRPYLLGEADSQPKDAEWAAAITQVPAEAIRSLAREMAQRRTFISASWSVQRQDHGEQPYWAIVTLASMLGHVGLQGGGFGFGYSAEGFVGSDWRRFGWQTLSKGRNPTGMAIPVARIAELLERPGESVRYDGRDIVYPETKLIYWAGGNPFHHHQDLNRLVKTWQKPDTVIVNEPWWTPVARHADIVFPVTTTLEREDVCASSHDPWAHFMEQAVERVGQARTDHEIFVGLSERLGLEEAFTEGRSPAEWMEWMWERSRERASGEGFELPSFADFREAGSIQIPPLDEPRRWLADFREDPQRHPLSTPSGKLEIFSEDIADAGDVPGHVSWNEPYEWLGGERAARFPLHLISSQPQKRLHSQLDMSAHSHSGKVAGREAIRIHPDAASERGIADGDVVRVFNDRGQCLAGARLDDRLIPEVVDLPTGAWFDPWYEGANEAGQPLELSGNPNVLTRDRGTSALSQGPSAHTCLVEVERFDGEAPLPRVYEPPEIVTESSREP